MVSRRSFIGAMARTFVLGTPAVALAGKASSEAFDEVNAEIDDVLFICEGDADCFVDVAPEIRRQIRVFDKAGAFKGREAQRARERVKAELADLKAQGPSEATDDPVAAGARPRPMLKQMVWPKLMRRSRRRKKSAVAGIRAASACNVPGSFSSSVGFEENADSSRSRFVRSSNGSKQN